MLRTRPQPGNETWPFEERNCYGHAFTPSLCVPSDGVGLAFPQASNFGESGLGFYRQGMARKLAGFVAGAGAAQAHLLFRLLRP